MFEYMKDTSIIVIFGASPLFLHVQLQQKQNVRIYFIISCCCFFYHLTDCRLTVKRLIVNIPINYKLNIK